MAALEGQSEDRDRADQDTGTGGGEGKAGEPQTPPLALIKEISHPLRAELMRRYHETDTLLSPRKLTDILGSFPLSYISYHTGVLVDVKALKLVKRRQVRGATEHFYCSTVKGNPMVESLLGPIPAEPLVYVPSKHSNGNKQ